MNCPICANTALVMTNRQNVEIDYCPQCRGVWLDRGELDKLMELAVAQANVAPVAQAIPVGSVRSPAPMQGNYRGRDSILQQLQKSKLSFRSRMVRPT